MERKKPVHLTDKTRAAIFLDFKAGMAPADIQAKYGIAKGAYYRAIKLASVNVSV